MTATRVGIIGLSAQRGWAATAHLPALRLLPDDFDVVALTASGRASAEAAAQAHGVPHACADEHELVARDDVDLVVVTVKVPEHHRLVSAALEAGKAVLCEWPLGNGLAEAQDLAAKAQGLRSFVGLQARSAPAVRLAAELVRTGAVGEVLSSTLVGSGDAWGPVVGSAVTYLLDRDNGATMLTIPMGHTLEAVCHVLGELEQITATTATRRTSVALAKSDERLPMTAADQVAVTGVLGGGAVFSAHYRGGTSRGTNFLWEVNGTEGDLVLRGDTGHLQYGKVTVHLDGDEVPVPDRLRASPAEPGALHTTVAEAYALLATDLREGSQVVPGFDDAVVRHRTLDAIERAAQTGERQ